MNNVKETQIIKGWFYLRSAQSFHHNQVLNLFIDVVLSMMRGIASIIDGLVLLISLGRFATPLGFRAVVFIQRKCK